MSYLIFATLNTYRWAQGTLTAQCVRVRSLVRRRHRCAAGEHREKHGRTGRVRCVPHYGALSVSLALHDVDGRGSEEANGTFPTALQRRHPCAPSVRIAIWSCGEPFGQVKLRAIVVITVDCHQIAYLHGRGRFGSDWVDGIVAQVRIVRGKRHAKEAKCTPHAPSTVVLVGVLSIAVNTREIQGLTLLPPSLFFCHLHHRITVEEIARVVEGDLPDHKHVGYHTNFIVRHALCHPDSAGSRGVRQDVEDKPLISVANHEAFAGPFEAVRTVETMLL